MQLPDFLAFSSDSDRSKGETGSCCKSMHLLSLFFLLAALSGAEQRGVARLFSRGHPVAWWYLRRHLHLARLLAILTAIDCRRLAYC